MLIGMGSHFELWDKARHEAARGRACWPPACPTRCENTVMLDGPRHAARMATHHRPAHRSDRRAGDAADGIYVDGTFGRGGHSRALLARLAPAGRLIAFDQDPEAVAERAAHADRRPAFFHPSRQLRRRCAPSCAALGIAQVHGVLLDLGVSSPQIDNPARGFSFRFDGPLDMRMDHDPRRERRGFPGPRRRAPHRGGDTRLWGRTVCCTDCKGACCSPRRRESCSNHRRAFRSSWLVRSRPASRARTLQRAHFRLFGFSSTPSLRRSNRA